MWSRQWLNDEKIISLSDIEQAQLVRVFCVANECLAEGRFEVIGILLTPDQVAEKARTSSTFLYKLCNVGILKNDPFSFVNWEKWQNPDSKRDNKPDLKRSLIRTEMNATRRKTEDGRSKTKDLKETPTSAPSASPQAVFVDWYKIEYKNRFGKPYNDSKPDYIHASKIIKTFDGDLNLLKKLVLAGWNMPDEKNFSISRVCMTVSGFCGISNRITLSKPKPKTAYELELEAKR